MATNIGNKPIRLKETSLFNDANLVSYWSLDKTVNDSKGTSHGTATDIDFGTAGRFENGISFNGISNKFIVGTSSSSPLRLSPIRTYSFWFKINSGQYLYLGTSCNSGTGSGYILVYTGGFIFTWTPTTPESDTNYRGYFSVTANCWHHCVFNMSFAGTSSASLFIDGKPVRVAISQAITNAAIKTSYNNSTGDSLGSVYINSWIYGNGSLDDFAIFSRALTSSEALLLASGCQNKELFSTNFYSSSNLSAYYRFEGNANATIGGINGTSTSVTYGTDYGKFNQGASFNGSTSKIVLADNAIFKPTTAYSISMWVKFTTTNIVFIFCSFNIDNGILSWCSSGYFGWGHNNSTGLGSLILLNDNIWHHIVCTYDSSKTPDSNLYIDGDFNRSRTLGPVTYAANNQVRIGIRSYYSGGVIEDYPYPGSLDDLALFNRALTLREVKQLYRLK